MQSCRNYTKRLLHVPLGLLAAAQHVLPLRKRHVAPA